MNPHVEIQQKYHEAFTYCLKNLREHDLLDKCNELYLFGNDLVDFFYMEWN